MLSRRNLIATGIGISVLGGGAVYLNKINNIIEEGLRFIGNAKVLTAEVREVLKSVFDESLKNAERVTNEILSKNRLPYYANFQNESNEIKYVNDVDYNADMQLLRAREEILYFDTGEYYAAKKAHFVVFSAGVAQYLVDVERVRRAIKFPMESMRLTSKIIGVADGNNYGKILNSKYKGEYGEKIFQKNVICNGIQKNVTIDIGDIYNIDLAFLRAYGVAQVLFNAAISNNIDPYFISDVAFEAYEVKNIGKDYRIGKITMKIKGYENSTGS